jgi:hypothetical protein
VSSPERVLISCRPLTIDWLVIPNDLASLSNSCWVGRSLPLTTTKHKKVSKARGNSIYNDSNELSRTRCSVDPTFCAIWEWVYPKEYGDNINYNARLRGKVTTFGLDRVAERSAWGRHGESIEKRWALMGSRCRVYIRKYLNRILQKKNRDC